MAETLSEELVAWALAETERLQRELDITNADHIALWLEAQLPDFNSTEGFSGVPFLACRIIEAHEAALATAEPIIRAEERAKCTRAVRLYPDWCANWGQDKNMRAACVAAEEIAVMLERLPDDLSPDDDKAAMQIHRVTDEGKKIAEQQAIRNRAP